MWVLQHKMYVMGGAVKKQPTWPLYVMLKGDVFIVDMIENIQGSLEDSRAEKVRSRWSIASMLDMDKVTYERGGK